VFFEQAETIQSNLSAFYYCCHKFFFVFIETNRAEKNKFIKYELPSNYRFIAFVCIFSGLEIAFITTDKLRLEIDKKQDKW
jgi:hypothetical protein